MVNFYSTVQNWLTVSSEEVESFKRYLHKTFSLPKEVWFGK
jgi:hypothetical protein